VVEFKAVLVPLDGSPLSETALPVAAAIAWKFESQIILLRALDLSAETMLPHYSDATVRLVLETREHVRREARSYLKAQAGELREQGLSVRTMLMDVAPAVGIIDAAMTEDVDLIVMSTHGRGGLARWTFGSVADKVARHSPCPVMLVRQRQESANEGSRHPL
jgi:nucleotide-binding universal stress UspA family protein